MRNINDLHPKLQKKIVELKAACTAQGITIGFSECLRTVAEQDALYAKGRTTPGSIVTNCKGSTYSSMHQWGVAADFYLIMDVDGDGETADDAFNNSTNFFERVGKIAESIGLEWGGSWTSFKDLPHIQLKDWGSTASQLKKIYGTPENFFKEWDTSEIASNATVTSTSSNTDTMSFKKLVMELQSALNAEYKITPELDVDGLPGPKTLKATPDFSKAESKSKPLTTAALQALLNYHGCNCGTVDGIWGTKTNTAVGNFQKEKCGITPDYIFNSGKKSWKKLLNMI